MIATSQGKQPIGSLQVGDKVWAYNPKTQKMELEAVLHVWLHQDHDLVDLTISTTTKGEQGKAGTKTSEVIHTNKKHPFLTLEDGFLPVGQIKVGMHVVRADGRIGVISGWKVVPGVKMMYNLEVAQDHTFTVGSGQWVVHNCAVGPFDNAIQKLLKSSDGGKRLEAELAQLVQDEGYTLTNFRTNVSGPMGTAGDIDVGTPGVILEAKSGKSWDSNATTQLNKLLGYGENGSIMNPDGKPVIVYAPNMPEKQILWIQKTGAYVAQNPEQLFILLWYLSPPT